MDRNRFQHHLPYYNTQFYDIYKNHLKMMFLCVLCNLKTNNYYLKHISRLFVLNV